MNPEDFAIGIQGVAVGDVEGLMTHVAQAVGSGCIEIVLAHDDDCPQRFGFGQCKCSEVDVLFDADDENLPRIEAALLSFRAEAAAS